LTYSFVCLDTWIGVRWRILPERIGVGDDEILPLLYLFTWRLDISNEGFKNVRYIQNLCDIMSQWNQYIGQVWSKSHIHTTNL